MWWKRLIYIFLIIILSIVFIIVFIFTLGNLLEKSNMFSGFFRLPKVFDERVYSFYYTNEEYPVFADYNFSTESRLYNVVNPFDKVNTTFSYIPSKLPAINNGEKPLLLHFRGNGDIKYRMEAIKRITEESPIDVVVFNYRGSFRQLSHDHPRRYRVSQDNEAAWEIIKQQFPNRRYYVYGLSLGTGIATDFIKNRALVDNDPNLNGVILDNVFTSLSSSFTWSAKRSTETFQKVPNKSISLISNVILGLTGETYRNLDTWKKLRRNGKNIPLLTFSSGLDQVMDPNDGKVVADTMIGGRNVLFENVSHGSVSEKNLFYDEIKNFIY